MNHLKVYLCLRDRELQLSLEISKIEAQIAHIKHNFEQSLHKLEQDKEVLVLDMEEIHRGMKNMEEKVAKEV